MLYSIIVLTNFIIVLTNSVIVLTGFERADLEDAQAEAARAEHPPGHQPRRPSRPAPLTGLSEH